MNCVVILAAGSGSRMGEGTPKILRTVAGNTVLWHVLKAFEQSKRTDMVVLVVPAGMVHEYIDLVAEYNISKSVDIIEGGPTRMDSSFIGLSAVPKNCEIVAFHDAARAAISSDIIDEAMDFAAEKGSALVAGPVYDTIKQVKSGKVVKTVDRSKLMAAYTPQIFDYKEIMAAFLDARNDEIEYTDEASIMESAGYDVQVFNINKRDIKLTIEDDIYIIGALLTKGEPLVGTGIDTHRLVAGRKLILGGVDIAYDKGLLGHSDADVLVHAIMDALLGGAGMRDIGYHFPDTDKAYENADSLELLRKVGGMLSENNISINNIDATIICQAPKLLPYNEKMTANIADSLRIGKEKINVKATTTEGIGEHGNGEAISAIAVCSLIKKNLCS